MSQDGADTGRGCAVAEHISRGGVPQEVSAVAGRLDPRSTECTGDDLRNSGTCQGTNRCQDRREYLSSAQRWPALIQIEENRISHLLRQG